MTIHKTMSQARVMDNGGVIMSDVDLDDNEPDLDDGKQVVEEVVGSGSA